MELLFAKDGIDVNSRDIYGRTPQFKAGPGGARGGGRATAGQGQNAGLVGGRNGCGGAVAVAPKA